MNISSVSLPHAALGVVVLGCLLSSPASGSAQERPWGLTAVQGLKVGHFTLSEAPRGCTVILPKTA